MAITTPDAVPGDIIEAAWGDAVRTDLTNLENYDGYLGRRLPLLTSVEVFYNNVPQGITALNGLATILASPADVGVAWLLSFNYSLAGHTTGSVYRFHIVDASNNQQLAYGGNDLYTANEPVAYRTYQSLFIRPAGSSVLYLGFQLEVGQQYGNTNIGGTAVLIGIPY